MKKLNKKTLSVAVLALVLIGAPLTAPAHADPPDRSPVPVPSVQGPVGELGAHGYPLYTSWFDLAPHGYIEEEYFVSGVAEGHTPAFASTDLSGTYAAAEYTTRVLVTRPANPSGFNGTGVLEWDNVSAGSDKPVEWHSSYAALMREGFAYVAVTAQPNGVKGLQGWDAERYASLNHPGDAYSYDIFSQVAQAVRSELLTGTRPGLKADRVLATGHSQSGIYLHKYVNDIHPAAQVFDGFLVDADIAAGTSFPQLTAPVVHLQSEEALTVESSTATENYRLWQVPGAPHNDYWYGRIQSLYFARHDGAAQLSPSEKASAEQRFGDYGAAPDVEQSVCTEAGGTGTRFPRRYVLGAAIVGLDRWVRTGDALPVAPPVDVIVPDGTADGTPVGGGSALLRDEHGNATGGYRLPVLDVPVATYLGANCGLNGVSIPFAETKLALLYPSHSAYVTKMEQSVDAAVNARFMLPADGEELKTRARAASIGTQAKLLTQP